MEKLSPQCRNGKYMALYKCQLCGAVIKLGDTIEAHYEELPFIAGNALQNRTLTRPSCIPCKCDDGSCGVAYFAGFKRV